MKLYTYTLTVSPRPDMKFARFPIDMLRYDQCYPDTSRDVERIAEALDTPVGGPFPIDLVHVSANPKWSPTRGRWDSFGWTVAKSLRRPHAA